MTGLLIRTFAVALFVVSQGFAQSHTRIPNQFGSQGAPLGAFQPSFQPHSSGPYNAGPYGAGQYAAPYLGTPRPAIGLNAPRLPEPVHSVPFHSVPVHSVPAQTHSVLSGPIYSGDFASGGCDCGCGAFNGASCGAEPTCGVGPSCQIGPSCGFESESGYKSTGLLGFCARNGLAMGSFLLNRFSTACRYTSVDLGFANADSNANQFGFIADAFDGLPSFDLDAGAVARYALGWDFGSVRFETEIGLRRSSLDAIENGEGIFADDILSVNGRSSSVTVMANLFYDFRNPTHFTPYLRGGLGLSHNRSVSDFSAAINSPALINGLGLGTATNIAGTFPRSESTKFAWNLGAGLAIDLTGSIKFDMEYQFLDVGSVATGLDGNGNGLSFGDGGLQEVTFGLRFYR